MTFSAEFHCHRANITITADQMCDGTNDCPSSDEDEYNCPEETEDKDNNINEITSKNEYPQNVTNTSATSREEENYLFY